MEYNFKVENVYKDIESSLNYFMDKCARNYNLLVPITTDPCNFVAAHVIYKIIPERCKLVYIRDDRHHSGTVSEALKEIRDKVRVDRLKIESLHQNPLAMFYEDIKGMNGIDTLRLQKEAIRTFLMSKYNDIHPIYVNSYDIVRHGYQIDSHSDNLNLFNRLIINEIEELGVYVGMDEKLFRKLVIESEDLKIFHQTVGCSFDIYSCSIYFRECMSLDDISKFMKKNGLANIDMRESLEKYRPPVTRQFKDLPVYISSYNLYDQ